MNDNHLVLHVGAPKCGSSSIQTALSKHPILPARDTHKIVYGVIQGQSWLSPTKIRLGSKIGFSGYVASHGLHKYGGTGAGAAILKHHAPHLSQLLQQGVTPVLSSEGWLPQTATFTASGVLAELPRPTHVILFVRPPLDWLNSAFWQWGIWQEPDIRAFLEKNSHRAAWVRYVKAWKAVPGVEKVSVRLMQRGVIGQFYDLLGCTAPSEVRSNTAVPPFFLQLMFRNRHLRPDAESPEAEFIVGARIGRKGDRSGWALPPDMPATILAELEPETRALLDHLEPEDRAVLTEDPAWWDAAHYADRRLVSPEDLSTPEVMSDFYQRLCAVAGRTPDPHAVARISRAAAQRDLEQADAPLLEMIDVIYGQSWRWKATRARRWLRALRGRAPLR